MFNLKMENLKNTALHKTIMGYAFGSGGIHGEWIE